MVLSAVLPGNILLRRINLIGERKALGRDDQGDDHLHAVAATIPAVAEAAGILRRLGRVALEVGARQVVEEHLVTRVEEVRPAFAQMDKDRVLVLEQAVVPAIERIILGDTPVHAEQIGQRGGVEPVAVQAPLRAGRDEPVKHEHAQDFFPIGALAALAQTLGEEGVEPEAAPEQVAQPARAPLPRAREAQAVEPHLQGLDLRGRRGRGAVRGEQRHLARLARAFVDHLQRSLPRLPLAVVELAKVKDVAVRHLAPVVTTALHDRPTPVDLPILATLAALQEHAPTLPKRGPHG